MEFENKFDYLVAQHTEVISRLRLDMPMIVEAGSSIVNCLKSGNKILVCGNGGSASDAQHFVAEIIGRFEKKRGPFPAIALTTDTSVLTAVSNDFGYDTVFERQVGGLGKSGDLMVAISTSGNSRNVIKAVNKSTECGIDSIGLLGRDGGVLSSICKYPIIINSQVTARIQEAHIFLLHFFASIVDDHF